MEATCIRLILSNKILISLAILSTVIQYVNSISIKPADFDRLIMPCYLASSSISSYNAGLSQQGQPLAQNQLNSPFSSTQNGASYSGQFGRGVSGSSQTLGSNNYQPAYYSGSDSRSAATQTRDSLANLGQQVPRANTIDNFIALVSKIESANPRLANNPDQLIKTLLGRFRMDNYYYDVRGKTPISDQDRRITDILPAILNPMGLGQQSQMPSQYLLSSDVFPEQLLDHDEKCSMYFMLSHFIDKGMPLNQPLSNIPVPQLTGPLGGQKPPVLQAAGSGYPAQSANNAFGGGPNGSPRYPGPSPSFGSPATNNMNSFGAGLSNNPDYTGKNPYGMNVPQVNNQFNQNYNNIRNSGQYSGTLASNSRYSTPYIDGQGRSRDDRIAQEYGVVTVANQENAALVLNRVLMGILAATSPPQTIRQLSTLIYPTQSLTNTPKFDEEIDPLFAVTLADLWAITSIPKPGKPLDVRMLGDNGHWNSTMCPTSFQLERSNSIRFTTAELIGGLDGFSLGMFRRRLMSMRKNMRLSEMLRMYYSRAGFRPQFAEVGVCNRASAISTQMDDLHRQAENYLRLYQLNLPTPDAEIAKLVNGLDSFKEVARQVANQLAPPEICQDSGFNDPYPTSPQDQCEVAKADIVTVLDTSPQANNAFMSLVVAKLAQKLGLSAQGNSLSVLTNQQDTSGYAGAYSFNAIVRNSTNTAEIGCALTHDTSRSYQGGQITEPTRLMEMFERSLVNLDSEYLIRQSTSSSSSYKQSSYVSSLFGQSENMYMMLAGGPKNTGGAKVIIWFNYGQQGRQQALSSSPTNWNSLSYSDQNQYKFQEAKKFLRENFRGASILAVSSNREDVKPFVFDEDRDIFTDIPQGDTSLSQTSNDYYTSAIDPTTTAMLAGPSDQLVNRLIQRMCDIPAVFQYPMCFRMPSDNSQAVGYISPGRRQYWMMSPKTFFASRTVRMVFKVDGGRLRVCFGRMTKPDESAARNPDYQSGGILFGSSSGGGSNSNSQYTSQTAPPSPGDYYTGLNYGICKDVSPGQEIEFAIADPCYRKSIAECEPFYFVISENSNPGEGDPNYMCKDEGCKRFDQVKFTMTHTGVSCSSALKAIQANWMLVLISLLASLGFTGEARQMGGKIIRHGFKKRQLTMGLLAISFYCAIQQVQAQQAGVHDFGLGRYGEKRGNLTPSEVLSIILLVMTIVAGLALTIGLCYYVSKQKTRGMEPVETEYIP